MRTFVIFLLSAVSFILHITLAPMISIFGYKIDFIMISVIYIGIFSKKWYPPVLSAVYSGLMVDITTQYQTYINTWMYLFIGVCVALYVAFIKNNNIVTSSLLVFAGVCFKHFIYSFVLYIMRLVDVFSFSTFFHGVPSAIYTAVIAVGVFYIYKFIFSLHFMQLKKIDEGKIYI